MAGGGWALTVVHPSCAAPTKAVASGSRGPKMGRLRARKCNVTEEERYHTASFKYTDYGGQNCYMCCWTFECNAPGCQTRPTVTKEAGQHSPRPAAAAAAAVQKAADQKAADQKALRNKHPLSALSAIITDAATAAAVIKTAELAKRAALAAAVETARAATATAESAAAAAAATAVQIAELNVQLTAAKVAKQYKECPAINAKIINLEEARKASSSAAKNPISAKLPADGKPFAHRAPFEKAAALLADRELNLAYRSNEQAAFEAEDYETAAAASEAASEAERLAAKIDENDVGWKNSAWEHAPVVVSGAKKTAQKSKMGYYTVMPGVTRVDRPVYQHEAGKEHLFYVDGSWKIGRDIDKATGGLASTMTDAARPEDVPSWRIYSGARKAWCDNVAVKVVTGRKKPAERAPKQTPKHAAPLKPDILACFAKYAL